ncbi:MAG: porin family protein [Crocinitomicaceae bacterium]|nr:porin family protein [Crocinitomicaceae bacterium]
MKHLLFTLFLSISIITFSQSPFYAGVKGGYMFNGKVQFVEGVVDLGNTPTYGITLGFRSESYYGFEFNYVGGINGDLSFRGNILSGYNDFETSLNIHHFSLDYKNYFDNGSAVKPFVKIGSGASFFDILEDNVNDPLRFSINIGAGIFVELTDFLALQFDFTYIAPLVYEGVGIHAGIGTGGVNGGLSLNASAPLAEFNTAAGILLRF